MTGKHSTKSKAPLVEPPPLVMPDPDNLQIDPKAHPVTGPIVTLPKQD